MNRQELAEIIARERWNIIADSMEYVSWKDAQPRTQETQIEIALAVLQRLEELGIEWKYDRSRESDSGNNDGSVGGGI